MIFVVNSLILARWAHVMRRYIEVHGPELLGDLAPEDDLSVAELCHVVNQLQTVLDLPPAVSSEAVLALVTEEMAVQAEDLNPQAQA